MRRIAAIVIALILAAVIGYKVFARSYVYQGSLVNPPFQAADFQLIDQNGQPFRLSDQHGKVVLVFFGFTNCPDVCPLTMAKFKQVEAQLGNRNQDVRYVFITVDPGRDSPERIGQFLSRFDPSFIGLSGNLSQLENVWKAYGVYTTAQEVSTTGNDTVSHSDQVYVIDKKGNLRLTYSSDTGAQSMAQDVGYLLSEK